MSAFIKAYKGSFYNLRFLYCSSTSSLSRKTTTKNKFERMAFRLLMGNLHYIVFLIASEAIAD